MQTISIVGSGTMGNGIAHTFAQYGYPVRLIDISEAALEKALQTISINLDRQIKKGLMDEIQKKKTLQNISTFTDIKKGVPEADLIVEAVTEHLPTKREIFQKLDQLSAKSCILATNTSSISITELGSNTGRPDKVIGMHFMNPVPVMPLVEIIRGFNTSEDTVKKMIEVAVKLGKTPVEVKDFPGFISNRILMPMINEAIYALYQGIAGVKEIDTIMKLGMGHPMGPLQLADFIGLDVCLSILQVLQAGFGQQKYAPCPLLVRMVQAGHLGRKSGSGFYNWEEGTKDLAIAEYFIK
jgi:3-hydroxybutyryl-CoA dehydrogenase